MRWTAYATGSVFSGWMAHSSALTAPSAAAIAGDSGPVRGSSSVRRTIPKSRSAAAACSSRLTACWATALSPAAA